MRSDYLKWVILGSVGAYLVLRSREGQADGKLLGFKANPDQVIDTVMPWVKVNPTIKPMVRNFGRKFLENVIGEDEEDVIDVKYRKL